MHVLCHASLWYGEISDLVDSVTTTLMSYPYGANPGATLR